jgi:hypothetical protein
VLSEGMDHRCIVCVRASVRIKSNFPLKG